MDFRDYFSRQSEIYRAGRPTYPEEMFIYLAKISPSQLLCWDCATGNGQAAVSLSKYFRKIIATDASAEQVKNAIPAENIEYRVASAEESGLEKGSADLITVATAAHWFRHNLFYAEAERVAKANGILAIWTYSEAKISIELDKLMEWFMYDFLGSYWPAERWYVRKKYENLPFPYDPLPVPDFVCRVNWNKQQWLNYVRSWSSYNNYVTKHQSDPLEILLPPLNELWTEGKSKQISWQLHLKCTRLNSS